MRKHLRKLLQMDRKGKGMLALLLASFLFLSFTSFPAYSSMEPDEIKEINERAPYHLIGAVVTDQLVKPLSESKKTPEQLRMMTVEITEIDRIPHDEPLRVVEIYYTFVPAWVPRDGGKGMDIAEGDVIEIWLADGEYGLEPAAGGDSVHHIFYEENRPEHFPEPLYAKAAKFKRAFFQDSHHTVGNVVVLSSISVLSLLLAALGIRKMKHS